MKRLFIALGFLIALPCSVAACLWDRDTPADEAKGLPEVVAVLTGRFPRNPPLFYEMRLNRVSVEIQKHPDDLGAHDDAGVACDRLGRGDEAIGWMKAKRDRLDKLDSKLPDVKEHIYRYHANLGTFLVHRWFKQGADRSKIVEVKAARDEIAKALEINPNAHFGRETYQLKVLEWILNPPKAAGEQDLPNLLGWSPHDIYGEVTKPKEADEAVRGLSGLIVLGNAWESVDIFQALNIALQRDSLGFGSGREGGRNTMALFALLRSRELVDQGKTSILPDAPKGDALKPLLYRPDFVNGEELLEPAFLKLRQEADGWQKARTVFMMTGLKLGLHPDKDPNFWKGYVEKPAPQMPTKSVTDAFKEWMKWRTTRAFILVLGVPAAIIAALISAAVWISKVKARRQGLAESEDITFPFDANLNV